MIVVLVAIPSCIALLYFWLVGHWFARLLAFPCIAAILLAVVAFTSMATRTPGGAAGWDLAWRWLALIACIPAAWLISGAPGAHWRERNRMLADASRRAA